MKLPKLKQQSLNKAYDTIIQVCLYDRPLADIDPYLADDVMNFGAGKSELTTSKQTFLTQIENQKRLAAGLKMDFKISPVLRKITNQGNGAIYTDDIINTVWVDGVENILKFRLSFIFEFRDNKWIMLHSHTSAPDSQRNDNEVWPLEELKKRTAFLEKSLDEKIAELELKNRELEIEASLERVRARSMAMYTSEEMMQVIQIIFQELNKLGFDVMECSIVTYDENPRDLIYWSSGTYASDDPSSVKLEYFDHPILVELFKDLESGVQYRSGKFKGELLKSWWERVFTETGFKHTPKEFIKSWKKIEQIFYAQATMNHGFLEFVGETPLSDDKVQILKRFTKVVDLTYTRFDDVKKAEAQAREAQIEAALERTRTKSMLMQHSSELIEISKVFHEQLLLLNIPSEFSYVWLPDEPNEKHLFWATWAENHEGSITFQSKAINYDLDKTEPYTAACFKAWESDEPVHISLIPTAEVGNFFDTWSELIDGAENLKAGNFPDGIYYAEAYMKYGCFGINIRKKPDHEVKEILRRFAVEFQRTYSRFLDLKKAEAQAREAQIETALEKVRSRTIGMQRSDELQEAAMLLFQQVEALGVPAFGCGFNIWDDSRKFATAWMAGEDRLQLPFKTSSTEDIFLRISNAAERGESLFVEEQTGMELESHYKYLATIPVFKDIMDKMAEAGVSIPSVQVMHCAFFSEGYLMFITYEPVTEVYDIFKRFARVFQQTYTRFLDLQKAEAQAREAMIEASLERVRARSMAMHTSEEMMEVIQIIFQELDKLGFDVVECSIVTYDANPRDLIYWSSGSYATDEPSRIKLQYIDHPILMDLFKDLKNGVQYRSEEYSGELLRSWWDRLFTETDFKNTPKKVKDSWKKIKRVFYAQAAMNHGFLEFVGEKPLSEDKVQILKRFTNVVDLTYTRFDDVKKAEEQAREANIEAGLERVRARSMAMHTSEELQDVIITVFQQLQLLGIKMDSSHLQIYDDSKDFNLWIAVPQSNYVERMNFPYFDHPIFNNYLEGIKSGKKFISDVYNKKEKDELFKRFFANSDLKSASAERKKYIFECSGYARSLAYGSHAAISYVNYRGEPYSDEENEILVRFANVFDQTYTRFSDLKKTEAQAREAQIEVALERVRARSMAMHQSDELKDVIRVIFDQMTQLNINAEHAGIVVDYKPMKDFHFWVAETQDIPSRITVPYLDLVWDRQFTEAKKKGMDFFTTQLDFEEKNSFYKVLLPHIQGLTKKAKDFYFTCPGLSASTVLEKDIGLYIENFKGIPYTDEENNILKRFGKVFQQTYTRFLDLQKSEAQAREAQIEAALEKVRSRSLAMHTTDELGEVVAVIVEKLSDLGVVLDANGVVLCTYFQESKDVLHWMASPDFTIAGSYLLPYFDHPIFNDAWQSKESGTEYFSKAYSVKEKDSFFEYAFEHSDYKHFPDDFKQWIFQNDKHILSFAWQKNSAILIPSHTGVLPTEDDKAILIRFAKVFEQAYIRFMDLQKAEAQAREAQIEAALERVRSKAMAMHSSDDLGLTVDTFFSEITGLNVSPHRCGVGIVDSYSRVVSIHAIDTNQNNEAKKIVGNLKLAGHPVLDKIFENFKLQNEYHPVLRGKEILEYYSVMNPQVAFHDFADDEVQYGYYFYFKEGGVFAWTDTELKEQDIQIFRRYTSVLSLTYRRYLDLKDAEAQAREAQIEAALERVRSRTLAMHNSDELAETAAVVFKQLIDLGIAPNRLYIAIIRDDSGDMEFWITDEDGSKVSDKFIGKSKRNASIRKMYAGWKAKEKSLTLEMKGKELKNYFEYLSGELNVPFKLGLSQKKRVQNLAYFSQGFIGMASPDKQPEETRHLMERFAAVFNLTYTRFSDLQMAEAKTREANIETALERVRARALAMQQPEELKEVALVLRSEMGDLGVEELETSSIYINDENAEKAECWYAIKDVREKQKVLINDYFSLNLNDTWVGREMLRFYKSKKQQVSIIMTGKPRIEWIRYCEEKSIPFRGYYGEVIPDRTYHLYKFSHGAIGVATPDNISEENWGLLKRAASVFSLAYSRFKDLTQARIDLHRLKEEKKRAEDALSNLEATQVQLVHAEKMASLGELTAGIAHEIQNPLNFVNNFSEVNSELIQELKEEIDMGELDEAKAIADDIAGNEEKIKHHGKRADDIVKGMLQHSRTTAGEKELTDINELADEFLRLAYHGLRAKDKAFNSDFKTDLDENLPKVKVVAQDIGRVLLNMINNAFYAVSANDLLGLKNLTGQDETLADHKPLVVVSTKALGDKIEIRVKDNGPGIPDQVLNKIFQPFFTTKPTGEGTGLGLSLSYDIITKGHGGELTVETKENEGTTFIILLPTETSK